MTLAPLLLALMLPVTVQAQFNYTTNNGTITITGYTGPGGEVTIPNTIEGLLVTTIGETAFRGDLNLISVLLPDSVSRVESAAFYGCINLGQVTIGGSVAYIGEAAYLGCTSLTSVTIPDSVAFIGDLAFGSCANLTSISVLPLNPFYSSLDGVLFNKSQTTLIQYPEGKAGSYTIPNTVTTIAVAAFSNCANLTSVTIPDSVTEFGSNAFAGCVRLAGLTIPHNVTSIGSRAFSQCRSLSSVTIPDSVTFIGGGAFDSCTNLISISVLPLNGSYSSVDGVLFNRSQTALIQYPGGKTGSYTVPNTVTSIEMSAFSNSANLTGITIPDGVTHIGSYAFAGCVSLVMASIPDRVTSLESGVFFGCTSLTNVTMADNVTSIGRFAFFDCTSLMAVTIPHSVTNIGDRVFSGCISLTGVYFEGNAPSHGLFVWDANNVPGLVYYLPGTTGWEATFGGCPTAPWWLPNPQILNFGSDFGLAANGFGFIISWATNTDVVVEASPQLTNATWSAVGTNTLTDGSSYFRDPDWASHPARFYRLRSP